MSDHFLVSTDWLAEHIDDGDVRVLDVSGFLDGDRVNRAHDDYLAEHLPGAVWFDVASASGELSDPDSTLSWTWPPLAQIEAAMGRVGVDDGTTVVLVARTLERPYGVGTMWCTRAWWTLHHSGVACAILEGGIERWCSEGRPTESGPVSVASTTFRGEDRRSEAIADRRRVESALDDGASCVIDALPEGTCCLENLSGTDVTASFDANPNSATWLVGEAIIYEIVGTNARRLPDKASGFDLLEV